MNEISLNFGDCITGMRQKVDSGSVDLCVTSIPFGALFMYSKKTEDIGNNLDGINMHEGQFGLHMRFFIEQLYRILKPGSMACIHIQQLLRYKVQHGFMGLRDFRGSVITLFENHGFQPHGEFVIVKNPRKIAKRLNLHSLQFVTGSRDSRALSPAMNDYVLLFRKPGEGTPIKGIIETKRDVWLEKIIENPSLEGEVKISGKRHEWIEYDDLRNRKSVKPEFRGKPGINPDGWFTKTDWVKWAHGVWNDILEIDTLEGWRKCKENSEERHICPLQLEVIRRCIKLYSAPWQTVIDPFMGIGSTAYVCVEQDRNCIGFELKESYHRFSQNNVKMAWEKFETKKHNLQMEMFG